MPVLLVSFCTHPFSRCSIPYSDIFWDRAAQRDGREVRSSKSEPDPRSKLFLHFHNFLASALLNYMQQLGFSLGGQQQQQSQLLLDAEDTVCPVSQPFGDMIVGMRWGLPNQHKVRLLAAASWDGTVRVWRADLVTNQPNRPNVTAMGAIQYPSALPPLDCAISSDLTLAVVGVDRKGYLYNVSELQGNPQPRVFAQAKAGISRVFAVSDPASFVTASWDGSVSVWDCRQQQPAITRHFGEPIADIDVKGTTVAIALSRMSYVCDLRQLGNAAAAREFKANEMLRKQQRCISLFGVEPGSPLSRQPGIAVGSTEGRVQLEYIDPAHRDLRFTFKCHRQPFEKKETPEVYPVNDVSFDHASGIVATSGGDGMVVFWDKSEQARVQFYPRRQVRGTYSQETVAAPLPQPVVKGKFEPDGQLFAYAGAGEFPHHTVNVHAVRSTDLTLPNRRR